MIKYELYIDGRCFDTVVGYLPNAGDILETDEATLKVLYRRFYMDSEFLAEVYCERVAK